MVSLPRGFFFSFSPRRPKSVAWHSVIYLLTWWEENSTPKRFEIGNKADEVRRCRAAPTAAAQVPPPQLPQHLSPDSTVRSKTLMNFALRNTRLLTPKWATKGACVTKNLYFNIAHVTLG